MNGEREENLKIMNCGPGCIFNPNRRQEEKCLCLEGLYPEEKIEVATQVIDLVSKLNNIAILVDPRKNKEYVYLGRQELIEEIKKIWDSSMV